MKLNTFWRLSLAGAAILVQAACGLGDASVQTAPESAAAPVASTMTLPEGTVFSVRTNSALSTNSQESGQTFTATLEQPLLLAGREIVARGALVEGKIVESNNGGRVKGVAKMSVRLIGLHTAGGQLVDISTNTVTHSARTSKGRDAVEILAGSGIGAALGAIAGGGRGAGIGAAAGAGAGTGLVLATRGDPAVIPSETVLNFELRAPVTIFRR